MKNFLLLIFIAFLAFSIKAQNIAITDVDAYSPDAKAMLDVYSTEKGMLVPRIALTGKTTPIADPKPDGLLIWNTSTSGTYPIPGFYYWRNDAVPANSDWIRVGSGGQLALSDGLIFIGNASDIAAPQTLGGDVSMTNTGVVTVGKIQNQPVQYTSLTTNDFLRWNGTNWVNYAFNVSDYPDNTKLNTALGDGQIFVGNAGTATARPLTGDAEILNTGKITVTAISGHTVETGTPGDQDFLIYDGASSMWKHTAFSATSFSDNSKLDKDLGIAQIFVGDDNTTAQPVTMSGDATIDKDGKVTINSIDGDAITLGGSFTTNQQITLQSTGAVTANIPVGTSTLATLGGTETLTSKTLTSPVINTPTIRNPVIYDANDKNALLFSAAANPVNYITISNADAGNTPKISASGADTHINFELESKGDGYVIIDRLRLPTGAATDKILISDASGNVSWGDPNTGSVTKVGLSLPAAEFSTISPVTSSGTLKGMWKNQAANTVFAGPEVALGTPSFRNLVEADIPDLPATKITSGQFNNARINWAEPGSIGATTQSPGAFSTLRLGTSTTAGFILTADANGYATWQASPGGQANTASNVGIGGVGVFKTKNVADLQFRNINAASSKISVVLDAANNEVDIDLDQTQITGLGTIVTGVWNATPISETKIANLSATKITSGQFNNDRINWSQPNAIGSGTPSTAVFSTLKVGTYDMPTGNGTNGQVLTTNGTGTASWQTLPSSGETNTASNVGTAGVGVFDTKNVADLQFRNINAASSKITVTLDGANNEVDIDLDQTQITGLGTIVTGVWNATPISETKIANLSATKITSGQFNNDRITWSQPHAIGKTTASTGIFTTLQVGKAGEGTGALNLFSDNNDVSLTFQANSAMVSDFTYVFPIDDGTANQFLQTDGAGNLAWATFDNGLTSAAGSVKLGGALTGATSITLGANNFNINLDGTGEFDIQDNGTSKFHVENTGEVAIGSDAFTLGIELQVNGDIKTTGAVYRKYNSIPDGADYNIGTDDYIIIANFSAAYNINLPAATNSSGRVLIIKSITNNATIDPDGAETIDGNATLALSTANKSVTIICDGSQWYVISSN